MAALYQAVPFALEGYVEATTLPDRSAGVAVFANPLPEPLPGGVTVLTLTEFVNRRALLRQQILDWATPDADPDRTRLRALLAKLDTDITAAEVKEIVLWMARRLIR